MRSNSNSERILLEELVKEGVEVFSWKRSRWRLTKFRNGQAFTAVRLNRYGQPASKAIVFTPTIMVWRVDEQA